MKDKLEKPAEGAVFYEDDKVYAALANFPITKGHSVVVWKEFVTDLHLLNEEEYDYLMDKVNDVRNALLKTLNISKVYLVYMDETRHVHWHLFPRYNNAGFDVFEHEAKKLQDTSLAEEIKKNLD